MKFTTAITRQCNLRCRYCYISRDNREIDDETANKAVDFAIEQLARKELLDFGFFGGEPLLNFPRLRHIVQYLRDRQQEIGFDLVMGLTSNGVVLTPEMLEFMASERIGLCISLDGPEEVYYQQRGIDGRNGVFQKVVENLRRASEILPRVKINAVYGPDTLDCLPDSVRFLAEFGQPVYLNMDIVTPWTSESLEAIDDTFKEIGRIYLDRFRQDGLFELHPLEDSLLVAAFGGCSRKNRCTLGVGELAVDVTGEIYPCERLVGYEQLIIGDVRQGFDEKKRSRIVRDHGQPHTACIDCSLKEYCDNSCGCTNWFLTGHFGRAHHVVCRIEKALHSVVSELLEPLNKMQDFHDYIAGAVQRNCCQCGKEG
ncbi:MAG: radical SAM protein [Planctomycetes bacterium]|nr:radical SAM protein [Planctomycetota bacterium]